MYRRVRLRQRPVKARRGKVATVSYSDSLLGTPSCAVLPQLSVGGRYCQELWIPFLIQAALLFKFSSIPSTNFPPCIRRATSPGALTRRHRRLAMSSSL